MEIASAVRSWNTNGNAGLVVGATNAESLSDIRSVAPDMPLLVPGIGAQGGDLAAVMQAGPDQEGGGLLINSSRGIIHASSEPNFAEVARAAAITLRDAINALRG
jgi:orotidine-5'-phosphate decarboxylase